MNHYFLRPNSKSIQLVAAFALAVLAATPLAAGIIAIRPEQAADLMKTMKSPATAASRERALQRAREIAKQNKISLPAAHYEAVRVEVDKGNAVAIAREIVFHLEESLRGGHKVAECHAGLGEIYLAAGDFEKAVSHLQNVADDDPDIQLKLARVLLIRGDKPGAIEHANAARTKFAKRYRDAPSDRTAEIGWLASLGFLEQYDQAIAHLKARLSDKDAPFAPKLLSQILTSQFDALRRAANSPLSRDQFELLLAAIRHDAANRQAMERLILYLPKPNQTGPQQAAEFDMLKLLESEELPAHAHLVIGSTYMNTKSTTGVAQHHMKKAYEKEPENPAILNNCAYLLSHLDPPRLEAAMNMANELVDTAPKQLEFRETRGQILLLKEEWALAYEDFQQAVKAIPDYAGVHRGLAVACEKLGKTSEARRHRETYEKLHQRQP